MGYVTRSPGGVSIARQQLAPIPPTASVMNPKPRIGEIGRRTQLRQTAGFAFAWIGPFHFPWCVRRGRIQEEGLPKRLRKCGRMLALLQVRRRRSSSYGTAPAGGGAHVQPGCLVAPGKLQESFRSAIPAEGWVGWVRSQRLLKGV